MKSNLEQRLVVALVSEKLAASLLAKCDAPAALSSEEKKVLAIALADDKAAHEVDAALAARAAGGAAAPISRNAKDRITVALADDKAGQELIAKIQG